MSPSGLISVVFYVRPLLNDVVVRIRDRDRDTVIAVQAMGGTGNSRVVGANRHFNPVQDSLIHMAVFDEGPCGLIDAHIDGPQVVGGSDDHIGAGDETIFVGGVIVDQRSPGGLYAADAAPGLDPANDDDR